MASFDLDNDNNSTSTTSGSTKKAPAYLRVKFPTTGADGEIVYVQLPNGIALDPTAESFRKNTFVNKEQKKLMGMLVDQAKKLNGHMTFTIELECTVQVVGDEPAAAKDFEIAGMKLK